MKNFEKLNVNPKKYLFRGFNNKSKFFWCLQSIAPTLNRVLSEHLK